MQASHHLVCWQPVLTDHQAYTYQALARLAGSPMVAFVSSLEDPIRKVQGWSDTQVSTIERRLIPARSALLYCYRQLKIHRTAVHFFGSPFQQPRLMICLLLAMWLGVEFYLVSEPYSPQGVGYLTDQHTALARFKASLRPLAYRLYAWCLRKRMAGIFAISRLGVSQYRAAGVPPDKLFPFGYFVPGEPEPDAALRHAHEPQARGLKLIFVGALIHRKGLDILVDAVREVLNSGRQIQVDVFGPGELPPYLQQVQGITVHAPIAFGQASATMADYDFLVLPSRYDGWGVVVNEALCAGVPVVTSDTTGAGCVAAEWGAGLTFAAGDAAALAQVLTQLADDVALRRALKAATPAAAKLLQPTLAAQYLWDVVKAPSQQKAAVPSPWYRAHAD